MKELPFKGVIQTAYIVPDLEKAMERYVKDLKIGPWFMSDHFAATEKVYRGRPSDVDLRVGITYINQMNLELIQPANDVPSVWREVAEARGYGFHHFGVATDTFDDDVKRYQAQGYEVVFTCNMRGAPVAYIDTTRDMPGMIELIAKTPERKTRFESWYHAAQNWDGLDPFRKQ